ncbi:MAG: hypothetical protein M0Q95_10700 [Porticoccaceae bacterium]|nr:hypothetical protein [Porticoccaceae bacterium]
MNSNYLSPADNAEQPARRKLFKAVAASMLMAGVLPSSFLGAAAVNAASKGGNMVDITGFGFNDPKIWREIVSAISDLEDYIWQDPLIKDELTRAEGVRYLTRLMVTAFQMTFEAMRPDYPQLYHFLNTKIQWGLPSADTLYQWARLDGDGVYRITGDRGTAHLFDIETRTGQFAHVADWKLIDRREKFATGPNNEVEIVLSREKQPGNWIRLPDGPSNIIVRQYFYDWINEKSANLQIHRDGVTYPPPPLTPQLLEENAQLLIDWLRTLPGTFRREAETHYRAPENALVFDNITFGWKDLRYGKGTYECAEDEAIILEVTPPNAYYWNCQLVSHFWEAREWHLRQTSINGHQAVLDDDGVFRAVISHQDPGVPNWLDASGNIRGLVSVRYYRADTIPVPGLRRVKLADVRKSLPPSTPVVTAEERQKSLRDRAWSVSRRNCL